MKIWPKKTLVKEARKMKMVTGVKATKTLKISTMTKMCSRGKTNSTLTSINRSMNARPREKLLENRD